MRAKKLHFWPDHFSGEAPIDLVKDQELEY